MVRFEGRRTLADAATCVARHGGDAPAQTAEHIDVGDGLEVAELVRDVRHAVVVEDEPRLELSFCLGELGVRDAVARHEIQLAGQRGFNGGERRAVGGRD